MRWISCLLLRRLLKYVSVHHRDFHLSHIRHQRQAWFMIRVCDSMLNLSTWQLEKMIYTPKILDAFMKYSKKFNKLAWCKELMTPQRKPETSNVGESELDRLQKGKYV